jgi:hypothetical protein
MDRPSGRRIESHHAADPDGPLMTVPNPLVAASSGGETSPWSGIWIAEDIEQIADAHECALETHPPGNYDPEVVDEYAHLFNNW